MWIRGSLRGRAMLAGVMVAALAASVSRAAAPDVLNEVPGDAYAVVEVGNLRQFSNKLANAATKLELTLPSPDLVGYAARRMGIGAGLDANSSAAPVLLKPPASAVPEKYFDAMPSAVLILPTTDSKQMLEKFNPGEPDKNGVSQVSIPETDEKGFVAVVDKKWVVFGTKKEDVVSYLGRKDSFAKAASPDTLKVFEANDLVVWGNVEKLGAGADRWLEDEKIDRIGMLDLHDMVDKLAPQDAPLERHGINVLFDSARQFFTDANAGMLTVRLTDSGATLGLVADFKADSRMGKFVASQGGRGPVTLKGLPGGKFIAAGAIKWNSETVNDVVGGLLDSMLNDPALAKDQRLADMRKSLIASKQMLALIQGTSMILLEPPAGGKEGILNGAVLIDSSDPNKLYDLEMQSASTMLAQQALNSDIKTTATTTPNALTVKGVALAKISVNVSLPRDTPEKPLSPEEQIAYSTVRQMYGANGMTMYMGVVGKRVLAIYGSDMPTIEAAVTAAQADTDALANVPEIAAMKDQLVANPVAVAYLPIARWVTMAGSIINPPAPGGGKPGAAPAPAPVVVNAPPVVISAGVTGTMITAEMHLPIATLKGTQEAITNLEKAMEDEVP